MSTPKPVNIVLHQKSRTLEVEFSDGKNFVLTTEYLRISSPSAEVQGHGPGQAVLQVGKENVSISKIDPVGSYAICLHFTDGHDTGLYSWETLYDLGMNMDENWADYLNRLAEAGHSRKTADHQKNLN
jgi:DUF971 family protein